MTEKYIRHFKKGEVIFQENESNNNCAYLVESGQVDLYIGESKTPSASIFQKEIFGVLSMIGNSTRHAKAVAAEDTECCLIFKEQLNERINESDPIIRILLTNYLNRLRSSLQQNFEQDQNDKTKLTDIKSFGMGRMSRSDIKTEEQIIALIRLENRLHEALKNQEYHMHYQPIVDLKTLEPVGLEALIRLDGLQDMLPANVIPLKGMHKNNPDNFMSIAEKTSLIIPLGQWIIQKSCEQFGKLKQNMTKRMGTPPSLFISFNISGRQTIDPDFISTLKKAMTTHRIKGKEIKVEITEKELANEEDVIKWIKEVCDMGCSVAIDDFGTGYTNFKFLSQFDVENIKIDKSFIKRIYRGENQEKMKTIIDQLIQMSQKLGVKVIAEGIENQATCQLLQEMGCDYGQGYHFSRPMTMDKISSWLLVQEQKKKAA